MAPLARKSGDTFCQLLKEKSVTPKDLVGIDENIRLYGISYYLGLKGNKFARTKLLEWKNINLYITSIKRLTKTGRDIVVYQASNFKAFAKKHVQIYEFR